MLRLITGRARSGKTGRMIQEIAAAVRSGRGNFLLLVPEQYSHEAERELCRACGDSASRFAEVLSFTGLARKVAEEAGGSAGRYLDKGGRLLCMACALGNIKERLNVYGSAAGKAELQALLLRAVDELKAACITPEGLREAAQAFPDQLGAKLKDLELVLEAYDAVVANTGLDPADRLTRLLQSLPKSSIGRGTSVYVDGFTDFTAQELAVLEEMLRLGVRLTVCLTMDGLQQGSEIFALARSTALSLISLAEKHRIAWQREECRNEAADPLTAFADGLFAYGERYDGDPEAAGEAVTLIRAGSMVEECEYAAARAIALVRDSGCRWRDIAIAVRGFEDYRTTLEGTFRFYGVPLFTTRKSRLLSRPLPALLSNAGRILSTGWQVDDIAAYMRTGLTGLSRSECDTLENYIFLWKKEGQRAWTGPEPWQQSPDGYKKADSEAAAEATAARLAEINELRRRLARPLQRFAAEVERADCGARFCEALAELLKELAVPQQLEERSAALREAGELRLADEYDQMWRILVSALEQSHAILGQTPMRFEEFCRLFEKLLSGYDIGTIPVSLDRVSAGDFDRMRRRHIRHLIVLGAADARLPGRAAEGGVFSEEERHRLNEASLNLGGSEAEAWREFSLIYNTLSLPSDSLTLCYAAEGSDGSSLQPSFVLTRAQDFFRDAPLSVHMPSMDQVRLAAPGPALTAAAEAARLGTGTALAAAPYFAQQEPERWQRLASAAAAAGKDPRLSTESVTRLYGRSFRLGATRVENFADCAFGYFCRYGLKAEARKPAEYTAMEMGTFMHYVLEKVAGEVRRLGGFAAVADETLEELTERYVKEFIETELNGFAEKSPRFIHIFRRLVQETRTAVRDMAAELRYSGFAPLGFELNFGDREALPPVEFGHGQDKVVLNGVADRVDGWRDGNTLYLRVADYKSGTKTFSFSDVYNGKGMQMLLYLFALTGPAGVAPAALPAEALDGVTEILPAGVEYIPLRGKYVTVAGQANEEDGRKKQLAGLRRSGMLLNDRAVLDIWDSSPDKRFSPLNPKLRSDLVSERLANLEQMNALGRHIDEYLQNMAAELRAGSIGISPRVDNGKTACEHCDYAEVCGFRDKKDARVRPMQSVSALQLWDLLGVAETKPEKDTTPGDAPAAAEPTENAAGAGVPTGTQNTQKGDAE